MMLMTGGFINKLLITALLAGGTSGVFLAGIQHFTVIPMVLEAESYEVEGGHGDDHHHGHFQDQEVAAGSEVSLESDHEKSRTAFNFLTTSAVGIGFSLLLLACYSIRGDINWRQGIFWGLGGFVTFNLAPALGLPPTLPGADLAAVEARQWWWLLTVGCTAVGLLMVIFSKKNTLKYVAIGLILFPHLLGAPQTDMATSLVPVELSKDFIMVSLFTNALFWVLLGSLTALISSQFPDNDNGSMSAPDNR